MLRVLLLLLPMLVIAACASDTEVVESINEETGHKEIYQRSRSTGVKSGYYHHLDEKGLLLEEAHYLNDQLHGTRRLFYEDGSVRIEETYDKGDFHGAYRDYYPDGVLDSEGEYVRNEMVGLWRRHYPNGQLMEEVTFVGNLENGPFREWYENGALKATGAYLEGDKEHGELLEYDTSGELMARKECNRGICKTIWSREAEQNQ
jgi:antitoxin component YwqK of YwqJK toxin-antitoxin module